MAYLTAALLALLAAYPVSAQVINASAARPVEGHVLADVDGTPITRAELEAAAGTKLIRVRSETYNAERAVLDDLVGSALFKREAASRHVSVDAFLKQEVDDRLQEVSDEELRGIYEGLRNRLGNVSASEAMTQIRDGIVGQRREARLSQVRRELAAKYRVRIYLLPPRVSLSVADRFSAGDGAATKVTVIVFSDFQCPFCARTASQIQQVRATPGRQIHVIFRHFPLPIHRDARGAAVAAECAGRQGQFWAMHDSLFAHQDKLDAAALRSAAAGLSLDLSRWDACITSPDAREAVEQDRLAGEQAGVTGTPTVFVNGRAIMGVPAPGALQRLIDEELETSSEHAAKATRQ